jgi:hypothetical protein
VVDADVERGSADRIERHILGAYFDCGIVVGDVQLTRVFDADLAAVAGDTTDLVVVRSRRHVAEALGAWQVERVSDRESDPGTRDRRHAAIAPAIGEGLGHGFDICRRAIAARATGLHRHITDARGQGARAIIEAEQIEATTAVCQVVAECSLARVLPGQTDVERERLGKVDGLDLEHTTREVSGHRWQERLRDGQAVDDARGKQVEVD